MGISKTNLFSEEQNTLAGIAKTLGHPARLAILQHLLKANACINSDLVSELGLAQPTISQHLRELKNIDLIQGTIEGVSISYCINGEKWKEVRNLFSELFEELEEDPNECC